MRVRMLVSMAGPAIHFDPGNEYDLPAPEAKRLIAAGFAVPASREVEAAMTRPPENTMGPRAVGKKARSRNEG